MLARRSPTARAGTCSRRSAVTRSPLGMPSSAPAPGSSSGGSFLDRARTVGLVVDNKVHLPIRQQQIADTLGLSLVHTNKTLQKIREDGAIDIQEGGSARTVPGTASLFATYPVGGSFRWRSG